MAKNLNIQKIAPINDVFQDIIMGGQSAPVVEPSKVEEPKAEPTIAKTEKVEPSDKGVAKIMSFQCYPSDKDRYKIYSYEHGIKLTEFFRRATADYIAKHPTGVSAKIEPSKTKEGAKLMSFQVYEKDLKAIRDYAIYNGVTVTEFIRLATEEYIKVNP